MEAPPSPFVISTGAQRSGEICGVSGPFLEMFFDRKSWPFAPPKVMKNGPIQQLPSMEAPPSPLSSRPERSGVERSAVSAVLSWECFSTGGVMGLRPAQGDEKTGPVQQLLLLEAPASPLS